MKPDESLATAARSGDQAALAELLDQYRPTLIRHVHSMLRDADASQDVVQETMLRAWRGFGGWEGKGSVGSWLFRIATRLALNHIRSASRRPERPGPPPEAPGEGDLEGEVIARERGTKVRRMVAQLPSDKRRAVELVYGDGLEIEGAAQALGVPIGTVKSRLFYARKRLFEEWREGANEEGY